MLAGMIPDARSARGWAQGRAALQQPSWRLSWRRLPTFVPASAIVAACSYLASRTLPSILTLGMMAPFSSITTSLLQGPIWLTCTLSKQFCW